MFAKWKVLHEEGIRRLISVLKVNKRSNGSDIRQKAIPQMHPSVVQTMITLLF